MSMPCSKLRVRILEIQTQGRYFRTEIGYHKPALPKQQVPLSTPLVIRASTVNVHLFLIVPLPLHIHTLM